jgi:hypothetical protein
MSPHKLRGRGAVDKPQPAHCLAEPAGRKPMAAPRLVHALVMPRLACQGCGDPHLKYFAISCSKSISVSRVGTVTGVSPRAKKW